MKGYAIVSLAAAPLLISAAIVLRGCSPPAPESDRDSRPVAAVDASNMELWQERQEPAANRGKLSQSAIPANAAASDDTATTFLPTTEQMPPSAMARNTSANNPTAVPFLEQEVEVNADKPIGSQIDPAMQLTLDQTATSATSLRNADFPRTYISSIRVDLTSPNHWVRLTWAGPDAASQETGPFHSSPGRGLGNNDCDDVDESNRDGSNCTPKGTMQVQGFSDSMPMYSHCRHVTWFQVARGIAFHYYPNVPNYPASHGCVRLNAHAAQLIHNNSKIGTTEVIVGGKWEFGR